VNQEYLPVRFTLYTEKHVPQALAAIHERLQAKETAARPALHGWIERDGDFALQVSQPVLGKLQRTTQLKGHIERQPGVTVVQGTVPTGSGPRERIVALGALAALGLVIAAMGSPLLALLLVPAGLILYLPMAGDYQNGPLLVSEVQRALKAKATPPKSAKPAANGTGKSSGPARAAAKPAKAASRAPGKAPARPATPAPKPPSPARPRNADEGEDERPAPAPDDSQARLF
jgi:hypothetical protein